MEARIAALLLTCSLIATPVSCIAQGGDDFPDSTLSREQWSHRVDEARRRSEEFVANARTQGGSALPSNFEETEAIERAMHDPSLQQGDLVATGRGFFVFTGREERHQPSDFVPAQNPTGPR